MAVDRARQCWLATAALLAVALTAAGAAARDDDWPQWGHDGRRTGASMDRVKAPMTELWSWTPTVGTSPLYGAAIWRGRVYYLNTTGVGRDPKTGRTWATRALICANAKTGELIWKQPLTVYKLKSSFSNAVAPAVTDGGEVFVYDEPILEHLSRVVVEGFVPPQVSYLEQLEGALNYEELYAFVLKIQNTDPAAASMLVKVLNPVALGLEGELFDPDADLSPPPNLRSLPGDGPNGRGFTSEFSTRGGPNALPTSRKVTVKTKQEPTLVIRTFAATDGAPRLEHRVPKGRLTRPTPQMTLLHRPLLNEAAPFSRGIRASDPESFSETLGIPLLYNGVFTASTASDRIVRWLPDPDRRKEQFSMLQLRHPLVNQDVNSVFPVALSGFPPLDGPYGTMYGTDAFHRFFGVIDPNSVQRTWHLDHSFTLGLPSSGQELVYLPIGGPGASRAITGLHGEHGAPVWTYAPEGLPTDPPNAPRGDIEKLLHASHWSNPGLVVSGGCVFGEVNGTVVALKDASGEPLWRFPLPPHTGVSSIAASEDHLFVCVSEMGNIRTPVWDAPLHTRSILLALRRKDGKLVWGQRVEKPGNLAVSGGLVYFMDGGIHVFGPAERTYALATDSERPEDYRRGPEARPVPADAADEQEDAPAGTTDAGAILQGAAPPGDSGNGDQPARPEAPAGNAEKPASGTEPGKQPLAEFTCLRLRADQPREQLLARIKSRREAVRGVPLLLSLEALDETRARWTLADTHAPLTPEWGDAYVRLCAELAAAGRPEHFEILPEINVYLSRAPGQFAAVQALAQAAAQAIHAASPGTRVALSFNAEVLGGRYSRGDYRPFGQLPQPLKGDVAAAVLLAKLGDEVGLTTTPQMAYVQAREFPWDYLPRLCKLFGDKPKLLTRAAVRLDAKLRVGDLEQARFLRQVFRNCYWQDFAVVCYPELLSGKEAASPLALRVGEAERVALAVWRDVLGWQWRNKLTVSLIQLPEGDAEKPKEN